MKKLKYFSIFEAFKSSILSKFLRYIKDDDSKSLFLNNIKNICDILDFPYSDLNDDYFEYLPYKKAIELDNIKSIKSAISPKGLFKFWFSSEGKYIAATTIIKNNNDDSDFYRPINNHYSKNISDYKIIKEVTHRELKGGELVFINIEGVKTISYINNYDGLKYAIQDYKDGGQASNVKMWRRHGKFSWNISGGDYNNIYLIEPINIIYNAITNIDKNIMVEFNKTSIRVKDDYLSEYKDDINFAIIFKSYMIKSDNKKIDIVKNRFTQKHGSSIDPKMSNDNILKQNIERYISHISGKTEISDNIDSCNNLIRRSVTKNSLLVFAKIDLENELNKIMDIYYQIMTKKMPLSIIESVNTKVETIIKKCQNLSVDIFNDMYLCRRKYYNNEIILNILTKIRVISQKIYNKICNSNIESLEDLEISIQKIKFIKNIIHSNRYGDINLSTFLHRFKPDMLDFLSSSELEDIYYSLQKLEKIIDKI